MTKLEMAHEYAKELLKTTHANHGHLSQAEIENISETAFALADAMQAEAEKRGDMERLAGLRDEWQPDWSVAPDTATHWTMRQDGECLWWKGKPLFDGSCFYDAVGICHTVGYAPSFNYQGSWENSLRKKP